MTDMDNLAREKISRDTDKNIFVEAGAGSGKTTQLVERMTALVANGVDIGTICAITFTKAAAREFYGRFQVRLAELEAETPDETVRENCRKALDNIDLCFMGTIDSFSELILREHPMAAGIPSDFSAAEESSLDGLYKEAWHKIVSGKCSSGLFDRFLRYRSACGLKNRYFMFVVKALAGRKDSDIKLPVYERDINLAFAEIKRQTIQLFEYLTEHSEITYKGTGANKDKYVDQLERINAALSKLKENWSECLPDVAELVETADKYRVNCDRDSLPPEIAALLVKVGKTPNVYNVDVSGLGLKDELKEYIYCVSMELAVPALKMITEDSLKSGRLSFLDAKIKLRDMLRNDAAKEGRLIRHIRERHSHFLADEFQDTDPVQTEILFYLTAKEPHPDVEKCEPEPGTLFIVGDPKQSIYRFRGADIAAFLRTKKRFEQGNGEVLELTRNFRSTNKLKTEFNRLFSALLPDDTEIQSRFEDIPVEGGDDPGIMTGFWSYKTSKQDDCKNVSNIIRALINDPACIVRDPEIKELRRLKYKDIMVITPGKRSITGFLTEFRKAGIPCYAEGGSQLDKCPSFLETLIVFKALAEPKNSVALARVLKGSCFGLTEKEFSAVLPVFSLIKFKPTGHERTDRAFEKLKKLYDISKKLLPSVLFGKIITELDLLSHISADELECLFFARELLRGAETSGDVSGTADAAAFLEGLTTDNKQERSLRFELAENSVRIANLHKVKGLEANVVILASPDKKSFPPSVTTIRKPGSAETFAFSFSNEFTVPEVYTNRYFRDEYDAEETAGEAEMDRLIYVAATRARSILLVALTDSGQNYWSFLAERAEKELEYDIPDDDVKETEKVKVSDIKAEAADPFAEAKSKGKTYTLILPSKLAHETAVSSKAKEDSGEESSEQTETVKKRNAALTGTLVHRLMERLVTVRFKAEKSSIVKAVIADIGADESYSEMLSKVYDTVMNGGFKQEGDIPADIRAELDGAETMCEVPFCYTRSDELCNGVIDLIYRKGEKLCIVDYKTTAETENLTENFRLQLEEYKAAVKQILGEEAEAYIYHIDV